MKDERHGAAAARMLAITLVLFCHACTLQSPDTQEAQSRLADRTRASHDASTSESAASERDDDATASTSEPSPTHEPFTPSRDDLENHTYNSNFAGSITLRDGKYEDETTYIALESPHLITDVDGDGDDDAIVVLTEIGRGGTGMFPHLKVLQSDGQNLSEAMTVPLDDRVIVKSLTMDDGILRVNIISHGPDDPLCCPSQTEERALPVRRILESAG